jgi:hypothetical protein
VPLLHSDDVWDGSPHQNQPNLGHNSEPVYYPIETNAVPTAYSSPEELSPTSLVGPDQMVSPPVDYDGEFYFTDLLAPRTDLSGSPNENVEPDSTSDAITRNLWKEFLASY